MTNMIYAAFDGEVLVVNSATDASSTARRWRRQLRNARATRESWRLPGKATPTRSSFSKAGFALPETREAGLLMTLVPGAYTAIVSGVSGTASVSVVGVFSTQ